MSLSHSDKKQISRRYAAAMLSTLSTDAARDGFAESLAALVTLIKEHGVARACLHNPTIAAANKLAIVTSLAEKTNAQPAFIACLRTIVLHGRIELLAGIAESYREQLQTMRGEQTVTVTSATGLDATSRKALLASLKEAGLQAAQITETVDASLLGGAVIAIGSKRLDGSLAGQLSRLEKQLKQASA